MARFLDGPAKGVLLQLHRAPIMLRVVQSSHGTGTGTDTFDALDQEDDEPKPDEKVFVYIMQGMSSSYHITRRPRSQSGWYQEADYRLLPEQPDLSGTSWGDWCDANKEDLIKQYKSVPQIRDTNAIM